ncbi:MAG: nickel pincer cofactor biosynthesis protein LarB [Chloroflexota bacterium]|nr:nickel pincer cofactor biosynthesis protein LarB [Chloroflexota bacterium]
MDQNNLQNMLESLITGTIDIDQALIEIKNLSYEDLGFAKIDHQRPYRTGSPEVIFGPGKTPEQISAIVLAMEAKGNSILVTKTDADAFEAVSSVVSRAQFNEVAKAIIVPKMGEHRAKRGISVVTAGTADLNIAEEASVTAELLGNEVLRVNDVGVAGIHRLFDSLDVLRKSNVIIVVAGMEAAITSVLAGLVSIPIVAVPTSIGYGSQFEGLAALLGMLNSCAPGVATVNIDNGFGAGYLASQINQAKSSSIV